MNKFIFGISAALVITTTVSAYAIYLENQTHEQQLADYANQVEQLLVRIEENTRQRVEFEQQIDQLNKDLLLSDNHIQVLDTELEETLEKVNPDYEQIEREIRNRVSVEYQRQSQIDEIPTATSLINQLSLMNAEDRAAILSVQGQYGNFLDSLNVGPDRMEIITQALIDVTLGQSQARQDLVNQELPPREMRTQLRSILSPQAARDELAFVLDEQELALLEDSQQSQNRFFTRAIGESGVFRIRGSSLNGGQPGFGAAEIIISTDAANPEVRNFVIEQLQFRDQVPR